MLLGRGAAVCVHAHVSAAGTLCSGVSPARAAVGFYSIPIHIKQLVPAHVSYHAHTHPWCAQGNDKNSQLMIKRYITIIESMTDKAS